MAISLLRHLTRAAVAVSERHLAVTSTVVLHNNLNLDFIRKNSTKITSESDTNIEKRKRATLFEQARKYSEKPIEAEKAKAESESDSDSDDEKYLKPDHGDHGPYTSDFWRRKMRTVHSVLDLNNDGVVCADDFMLLAEKFHSLGHLSQEHYKEFKDELKESWESIWGSIDNKYNNVKVEQYLKDMYNVVQNKKMRKNVGGFLPYLFHAVDKDHNGVIDFDEFALYFKCLGLSERDAAVTFARLDTNNDGLLSLKHFVKYGQEFFLTEDEKRISKCFWGPLVH